MKKSIVYLFFVSSLFSVFTNATAQKFTFDNNNIFFYVNTRSNVQIKSMIKTPTLNGLLRIIDFDNCLKIYGGCPSERSCKCFEYKNSGILNPSIDHIVIKLNLNTKQTDEIYVHQNERKPFFVINIINEYVIEISPKCYQFNMDKFKGIKYKLLIDGAESSLTIDNIWLDEFALNNSLIIRQDKAVGFFESDVITIFINYHE